MKILFDTNFILDVLIDRKPFSEAASQLLSLVERGEVSGIICATTVTTIHYLSTKILGKNKSQHQIANLISLFESPLSIERLLKKLLRQIFLILKML